MGNKTFDAILLSIKVKSRINAVFGIDVFKGQIQTDIPTIDIGVTTALDVEVAAAKKVLGDEN